jgi:hypothetical protein
MIGGEIKDKKKMGQLWGTGVLLAVILHLR